MKKNLLLLINQLHGGGAQKVIATLSKDLQDSYNVMLAYYNDLDNVVFAHGKKLIGIELPYSANTHHNALWKRLYRSGVLIKKLKRLKKENQIDVSISFMEASNFVNILSRRNEKIILSVRTFLSNEFREHKRLRIFEKFIKVLYQKASLIITPAELISRNLIEDFGVPKHHVRVIPNYIDPAVIAKKSNQEIEPGLADWMSRHRVIVNVGRITPAKSQWVLPLMLKKIQTQMPDARLLILGEGISLNRVLEAAATANLSVVTGVPEEGSDCDLCMPGFRENPFPYLNKANLFIKSSVYEGFPNVIIEAMATGLPIISSDCFAGPREILDPETDLGSSATRLEHGAFGLLIPTPGNETQDQQYIAAAAEAALELLLDPSKYQHYRKQSLLRASQYSKETIIQKWKLAIEN